MGRRRRRVAYGYDWRGYPREISGRRGGRYTQISAQAKAEAADLFVVGGRVDGRGDGRDACRHLTTLREGNSRASSDALISDAVVLDDALNTREELERFSEQTPRVRGALCGNQPVRRVPSWRRRAARDRHRHAIEQASHRWRGGRRAIQNAPYDFHTGGARLLRELAGALSPRLPRRRGRVRGAAPDLPLGGGAVPARARSRASDDAVVEPPRRPRSRAAAGCNATSSTAQPSAGGPGGVR